jgi:hypothetical protein
MGQRDELRADAIVWQAAEYLGEVGGIHGVQIAASHGNRNLETITIAEQRLGLFAQSVTYLGGAILRLPVHAEVSTTN